MDRATALENFKNITGSDDETAQRYLEGFGWNADQALNAFFQGDSPPTPGTFAGGGGAGAGAPAPDDRGNETEAEPQPPQCVTPALCALGLRLRGAGAPCGPRSLCRHRSVADTCYTAPSFSRVLLRRLNNVAQAGEHAGIMGNTYIRALVRVSQPGSCTVPEADSHRLPLLPSHAADSPVVSLRGFHHLRVGHVL